MVMSITTADDNDVDALVGTNEGAMTDTMKDDVGFMAEAYVCCLVRYDVVTNWATIGAIEKVLITKFVATEIAIASIAWDMSGYTSRIEAEDMLNILVFGLRRTERLLADQKTLTFIQGGTP